jgi:hypothetical protein
MRYARLPGFALSPSPRTDSLESIGKSAFSGCISLKEVVFGKGPQLAENYGEEIFKDCVQVFF